MITHDLGVIASMCSRILVMYGGTICEEGTAREIFYNAKHPCPDPDHPGATFICPGLTIDNGKITWQYTSDAAN